MSTFVNRCAFVEDSHNLLRLDLLEIINAESLVGHFSTPRLYLGGDGWKHYQPSHCPILLMAATTKE